jgi:hypothetical protein
MDQGCQHAAADDELEGQKSPWTKLVEQAAGAAHMDGPGLHPAFVYLFAAIRRRPVACILCWQNKRLLFRHVRAGSLSATKSVATALRRTEPR